MKKIFFLLTVCSLSAFSADYSAMTATELQAMRGTVPAEDRAAYQAAVQERMRTMTQEEKQAFMQNRVSNPSTGSMGSNAGRGMGGGGMGGGGGHGRGGR
jgi:hypothetical protein